MPRRRSGTPASELLTDPWAPTGTGAADWFVVGDAVAADLGPVLIDQPVQHELVLAVY